MWSDAKVKQDVAFIFAYILYLKPEHLPRQHLQEDLNAATESAMPTS